MKREREVVGRRGVRAPPLPPTYSPVGCEAKGAVVGFTAPTTPCPHVYRTKLLRAVIPWEPQPPPTAAADSLNFDLLSSSNVAAGFQVAC